MSLRYVDRAGELCWLPPYSARGVHFFGSIVPCDAAALQTQADRYLNEPLGESRRFVPASAHAMFVFNSIDRLQSQRAPHWGYTTEQEMAVWLLLLDTRLRRLCWFHPYMFVDNDAALVSGRELYGFPKALGWFEIPRGPAAPEQLQVETMLVRRFGADSPRERAPLVTVKRRASNAAAEAPASLAALIEGVVGRLGLNLKLLGDFGLAGEALSSLLHADVPMVFLKQLRSAEHPRLACVQCVQHVTAKVDALHAARLYVGSRYQLEIHDADSHPLRRDLGLPEGPIDVALGYWLNFDLSIGECEIVGQGTGTRVAPKERIAILGGGMGALTTAFELSNEPDWQDRYEITVYQLGHRLGGKGASGRGPDGRIEEHGLHVWLGFYENAFRIIRRVYAELTPDGSVLSGPEVAGGVFTHWQHAFQKHSVIGVYDRDAGGEWAAWLQRLPENSALPGESDDEYTLWSLVARLIERVVDDARSETSFAAADVADATLMSRLRRILQTLQRWVLDGASRGAPERRRLLLIFDLTAAMVRGLIACRVADGRDLAALEEDFRVWLRRHGAREQTVDLQHNALLRGLYDFVFAFIDGDTEHAEQSASLETGVAIRTILRMFLTYRGAIFWKLNAGMGDTVFTPLYKVLKQRGVRFEFFSKVERLVPSRDGTRVEAIEITRQATLRGAEYEPLIRVGDLDCWPARPRYEQLCEGERLQTEQTDLETIWSAWPGAGKRILRRGAAGADGFERVVFGLSLGSVPLVCGSLLETKPAWRDMVQHVRTVATQGVQLWLRPSLQELGWEQPSPVSTAFAEPLDTWADMTHVGRHELWAEPPGSIAYFCGPLACPEPNPHDMNAPRRAREQVERAERALLDELRSIWPHALTDEAILARYHRANIDPSERYVMSVAGSSRYRLRADASGFDNLILTGDWIDNGYNAGCVEAAVLAGIQAANALLGRDRMHGVLGRTLLSHAAESRGCR